MTFRLRLAQVQRNRCILPKDSRQAMAALFFPSRPVRTCKSSSAAGVESHAAEPVDAERAGAAGTADRLVQLLLIGGLHEPVHRLRGEGAADAAAAPA